MAKQSKKPTHKPNPKPVTIPESSLPRETAPWEKYFPYLITALFFILSLIGILHHEMWRDEYQAWMVAADAHSWSELLQNLKYEGHPPLWHLFLFGISAVTDNPFYMQLFHILISTSLIFLFNRFSPFPLLHKTLFSFGYYTFFEYNLISRSYGLVFLLVMIACILYKDRQKNLLYIGLVILLLVNISIFGVILSACLAGVLVLERILPSKKSKSPKISWNQLILFVIMVIAGILWGYSFIRPEPNNSFPVYYITSFDPERARLALSQLVISYFSLPDFSTLHFWNTNYFDTRLGSFVIVLAPLLFLAWIISFLRYRLIVLLYIGGTLVLLGLFYYTGMVWSRYSGHLFLFLMACCWLMYEQKEKPINNKWLNDLSLLGNRIRLPLLGIILAIHFIGGVVSYVMDRKYPFSTSAQAAAYIRDNDLEKYEIIGSKDYIISPLASQLNRKILYAERQEYGTFIIYDEKRNSIWSFSTLQSFIEDKMAKDNDRVILAKSSMIRKTYNTGESEPWMNDMFTDHLNLKWLTTIEPGIVEDETYYIYEVDKVK